MTLTHHMWIPVAFVRQTGGRLHVLFAVEIGGVPAFDGEPVLIVDHRPGSGGDDVVFEPAETLPHDVVQHLDAHRGSFAGAMAAAFGTDGSFEADRLLEQRVQVRVTGSDGPAPT